MKLTIPNLPTISKRDPQLGEALKSAQNFVNLNVTPVSGNKVAPPPTGLVTPTTRPG